MKSLPKGKTRNSSAAQGLAYCNLLFEMDEVLAALHPNEHYDHRMKQAKSVLDALLVWTNIRAVAPKSALGKALTYLKEQWPYLLHYLQGGRLELSNNWAKRSIKPFVIERKNFLFANTPSGTKSSAVIFSLIQTATENGIDPYHYLTLALILCFGNGSGSAKCCAASDPLKRSCSLQGLISFSKGSHDDGLPLRGES